MTKWDTPLEGKTGSRLKINVFNHIYLKESHNHINRYRGENETKFEPHSRQKCSANTGVGEAHTYTSLLSKEEECLHLR